jgi:predicted lipoprotein with Yx(FWY)xxD motif
MRRSFLILTVVLGCAALASCSHGQSTATKPVVSPTRNVVLRVGATATQRSVLIDQRGDTLYVSRHEAAGRQTCTGQCLQVWPLVLLQRSGTVTVGAATLSQSAVTTVPVPDGRAVAYHGYLLHTYVGDPSPGGNAGQGVGGEWSTITQAGRPTA